MLARILPKFVTKKKASFQGVERYLTRSASCSVDIGQNLEDVQLEKKIPLPPKTVYPQKTLKPVVRDHLYVEEHVAPWTRTHRALSHDFEKAWAIYKGKPVQRFVDSTDILVIGGGLVGSSIALQLIERTGPGLNVTVLEMDTPECSRSLRVAHNGLYHQMRSKPTLELSQYAAEFYRTLGETFGDPDLPKLETHFKPNNSLRLASGREAKELEGLSSLYKTVRWGHQLLSSNLLKEKFPWLNVDGVDVGLLGQQKEGLCNILSTLGAIRTKAKKSNVQFMQGQLIGLEFLDQSDLMSAGAHSYTTFYVPRKAVIQKPSGEIYKQQFAFIILAAGASTNDVIRLFNVPNMSVNELPLGAQKCSAYEIHCPDGPGIEMPMLMESSGLKIRKSDFVNNYVVWDDTHCDDITSGDSLEANTSVFYEKLYPQLINRIPILQSSKLQSSYAGILDNCLWDDNLFVGVLPPFNNVIVSAGFGNDEFLFAPAVGKVLAETILEGFTDLDTSCFSLERVVNNIKINEILAY